MDDDDFITRNYQSELADIATRQNSILYLPTGSGKTYISILVIKRFLHQVQRSLKDGGKIVAIVVNKVPLVEQTARVMSRHLQVDQVGYYCGAMGVDDMSKEDWHREFEQYRVVVMTVQILVDVIRASKLRVDQLAVLVLDECHHAVGKDAMAQLMDLVRLCPLSNQPRILGMSATLLNGDMKLYEVDAAIRQLEATLNAKVITSYKEDVVKYSTKAKIRFEFFQEGHTTVAEQEALLLLQRIKFEGKYELKKNVFLHTEDFFHPLFPKNNSVKFPSLKKDIEKCIDEIGLYGGSKIVLNIICLLERTVLLTDDENTIFALRRLICDLTSLRENLSTRIFRQNGNVVLENSSQKLRTLVKVLKEFHDAHVESSDADKSKFCAIIFVQERLTAKILWAVLEDLSKQDEYTFLRTEFVVGTRADPREDIRSSVLSMEWNSDVLRRFSVGAVNTLISSNVLEEGIDIPDCNVVISYDPLKSYRNYIQAQGRARYEKSSFVVMIPYGAAQATLQQKIQDWESQRNRVNQYVGQTAGQAVTPYVNDDDDSLPPYHTPSGGLLEVVSALPVLNRYCMHLSKLDYFIVSPLCKSTSEIDKTVMKVRLELKMPIPCPLRTPVQGRPSRSIKGARRLAAFELCKRLHEIDELSDSLHPKKDSKLLHLPKLFPNWDPDFAEKPVLSQSKYLQDFPECLSGGLKEGQEVYLHVLKIQPSSARPQACDLRKTVYYDMFASVYDFAIVSAKKIPKVCDFPLFVSGVDLKVRLIPSEEKISLKPEELKALFAFHANLFLGPVPVVQHHTILDPSLDKNAYLIAPIRTDGGCTVIQWEFVHTYTEFPEVNYVDDSQRKEMEINSRDFELAVLKPWYRPLLPYEAYLVTEVCEDMDAESAFPTVEFDTFADYFIQKYNLTLYHKTAPLLEVRHFFTKIIALTPRIETKKKRWDKDNEEVREHMVPELCCRLNFPSLLWLKATLLPSALHRLHTLLICEELRQKISREAYVGSEIHDVALKELLVDPSTLQVKDKKEFVSISTKHGLGKGSIKLNEVRQSVQSRKPWGNEQEPVDISRSLETLNIMEIAFYEQFTNKNNGVIENPRQKKTRAKFTLPDVTPEEGTISLLAKSGANNGPQMSEIFQATTSKSANEIQHQETLTSLGRSVFQLAASVYLFFSYASLPAGKLQWVVSKLTSDHNVALCGLKKKLQGVIKVQEFGCDTWSPPFFHVPELIANPVIDSKVSSSVLNTVDFSPEEQRSGIIRPETRNNILELLEEEKRGDLTFGEYAPRILDYQTISIEDISVAVTALVGLYFKTNGLEGAMKVIAWFKLLPNDSVSLIMEDIKLGDHKQYANVDDHLKCVSNLEKKMQYKFRNRSYLLDALTHDSYIDAENEGQDRLSAVGYSILDFLIAIYVWESFSERPADEQEQMRAALSNRTTLAALLVRHDLHKYILSSSTKLVDVIDTFVQYQDERDHVIDEETFLRLFDYEVGSNEKAEVPAVLAHTFSALVGAVYLDTKCDLNETWRFVYRFLKNEIVLFSKNIPPQPKALLKDLTPKPSYSKFYTDRDTATDRYHTVCQINTNGLRKDVQASGRSAAESENTAAKKAVNLLIFSPDEF